MKNNRKEREESFLRRIEQENTYEDMIEVLKIEFGDFLIHAEHGKSVMISGLKARQKSILLRKLLSVFRSKSLKKEKILNAKLKAGKMKPINEHIRN